MTAALLLFQVWTLCCGAVGAAILLGIDARRMVVASPVLAAAFLALRVLV